MRLMCKALAFLSVLGSASAPGLASADFPERPVQIVMPFAAGSSPDLIVRGIVAAMSQQLGQPVVVVNQPGASGELGAVAVKNARADGYTIGFSAVSNLSILPNTRAVQFKLEDFDYICQIYDAPVAIVAAEAGPHKSLTALLDFARANPGKLLYGSTGPGTLTHISSAAMFLTQDVKATHVPMQSVPTVVQAILGGQIAMLAENALVTRSGNLRALAVLAPERSKLLPDVPSSTELKVNYHAAAWGGLVAPKGIPADARAKLEAACRAAVIDPAFGQTADKLVVQVRHRGGADFAAFAREENGRYAKQLQDIGLKSSP